MERYVILTKDDKGNLVRLASCATLRFTYSMLKAFCKWDSNLMIFDTVGNTLEEWKGENQ